MFICLMVFNATFNNISVISWRSVLLVEETRGPRENHRPVISHWQTWSHNVVHIALIDIWTHTSVAIGTDCIDSCKSNYHTITATLASWINRKSRTMSCRQPQTIMNTVHNCLTWSFHSLVRTQYIIGLLGHFIL